MTDGTIKFLQGVRDVFEIFDAPQKVDRAEQSGKIILIGPGIGPLSWTENLLETLAKG